MPYQYSPITNTIEMIVIRRDLKIITFSNNTIDMKVEEFNKLLMYLFSLHFYRGISKYTDKEPI